MSRFVVPTFIAFLYFLFTFGYIVSVGFYHVGELFILLLVTILLFVYYFKPQFLTQMTLPKSEETFAFVLTLIAIVNIGLVNAKLGDSAQTNWLFFSLINRILAAFALIFSIFYLFRSPPLLILKRRFLLLILIAVIIRIFSVVSSPNPPIDVFYILRDGPKLLLEGKNPYQLDYPSPYGVYIPRIIFVYGPLVPFLFLPSVLLLNDPRYLLILFDLLSVFLIYKLGQKLKVKKIFLELLIVLFLFHPLFPFMIEHAWLEPAISFFLIAGIYLLTLKPKSFLGPLVLGLILAVKNVYLLPLGVYLLKKEQKFTKFIWLIIPVAIFSLPFLILNRGLFLERTLTYATKPGEIAQALAPNDISLSLSAVVLKYGLFVIPSSLLILIGILVSSVLIKKGRRGELFSLIALFLVFMTLFMFGPFVFLNYFAFLGNILLFCILISLSDKTYE